jgi:Rab GDP dissociation inhibitor
VIVLSRLAAIYGGTYMLSKPVDKVVFNDDGTFQGVQSGTEVCSERESVCVCRVVSFISRVRV